MPRPRWLSHGRLKTAFALLAIVALLAGYLLFDIRAGLAAVLNFVRELGPWGPVLFIVLYVLAAILFVPGSALTLGAGAVFGVVRGYVYVSAASTLAAAAAFLIGRHLAREWVSGRIAGRPAFSAIDRAVAREGWKIVVLTRLSPLFPFTLLNYAFGLTQVRFRDYIIASWMGMLPGTLMYVYIGSLARAGAGAPSAKPLQRVLYGLGLFATIVITILVTRIARDALAKRTTGIQ